MIILVDKLYYFGVLLWKVRLCFVFFLRFQGFFSQMGSVFQIKAIRPNLNAREKKKKPSEIKDHAKQIFMFKVNFI